MKKLMPKIIIWFVVLFFILLNAISIAYDNAFVVKNLYAYAGIFKFLMGFWITSIIYLLVGFFNDKTIYKKVFLPLIAQEEAIDDDKQKYYQYSLFSISLILTVFLIISVSSITVISGHKCKENRIDNCVIEQSTLRTLYLPNINFSRAQKDSAYSFKASNILYSSVRPNRNNNDFIKYLLLLLVLIFTVRFSVPTKK